MNTPEDLFRHAVNTHQEGKLDQAKQLYRQILESDPNNLAVLLNLSLIVPPEEAIPLLRHAHTLQPNDIAANTRLVSTLNSKLNADFQCKENYITTYPWTAIDGKSAGSQIINLVCALPFDGIFASDNLMTWGRSLSFLGDKDLLDAINACGDDLSMARGLIWRTSVVLWAARNGLKREGDFVECGTHKGTTASIIYKATKLDKVAKNLWLYDLFDWDEWFKGDASVGKGPDLYENIKTIFKDAVNVKIIKGYIPDSFKQGLPEKISFLHVDMNNAEGEIAALNVMWDRVVPGGICILDDYGWKNFAPQKKEEDLFFENRGYTILELPTGQGMVLK